MGLQLFTNVYGSVYLFNEDDDLLLYGDYEDRDLYNKDSLQDIGTTLKKVYDKYFYTSLRVDELEYSMNSKQYIPTEIFPITIEEFLDIDIGPEIKVPFLKKISVENILNDL